MQPPQLRSPMPVEPTAQALSAETAATPSSKLPALRSGPGTRFQVVPFQCSIRAASLPARLEV